MDSNTVQGVPSSITTLVIDPGIRECGLSIWKDGMLTLAALIRSTERVSRGPEAWLAMARAVVDQYPHQINTLVVELQQHDKRIFNADDMFQVCGVVGAIIGSYDQHCQKVIGYYPRDWSKVPKLVRHRRLREPGVLTDEEWTRVEPCVTRLEHNRDDAICLGLFHLRQVKLRKPGKMK